MPLLAILFSLQGKQDFLGTVQEAQERLLYKGNHSLAQSFMWHLLKELVQVILGWGMERNQGGALEFSSWSPLPSGLVFKYSPFLKKTKPSTVTTKASSQIGTLLKVCLLSCFISSPHSFSKVSLPASFQDFVFFVLILLSLFPLPLKTTGLLFYSVCAVLLIRGCLDKVIPKALYSFLVSNWQLNCSETPWGESSLLVLLKLPGHGPFQPESLPHFVDVPGLDSVRREKQLAVPYPGFCTSGPIALACDEVS